MSGSRTSKLERQVVGTKVLLDAKILEFGGHVLAGNQQAAEQARTAASAALDAHLDLTWKSVEWALRNGHK